MPLYEWTTFCLSIHEWTFGSFPPFGYCEQCCYEHGHTSLAFKMLMLLCCCGFRRLTQHCVGFPKVKYLSGLRFPSPGDLSDPGIEPGSPTLLVYSLVSKLPGKPSLQGPVLKKEGRSSC